MSQSANTPMPIITAENVSKLFGSNRVLNGVSLAVKERDVVCIIGPSGSGKTTLLRCFAMLEAPSDGRIVMEGATISTPDPDAAVRQATELQQELRNAIADIRRLVQGLRPAALDDLGLIGALQNRIGTVNLLEWDPAPGQPL